MNVRSWELFPKQPLNPKTLAERVDTYGNLLVRI